MTIATISNKLKKMGLDVKIKEEDFYDSPSNIVVKVSLSYKIEIRGNKHTGWLIKGIDGINKSNRSFYEIKQENKKGDRVAGIRGNSMKGFSDLTQTLVKKKITLKQYQLNRTKTEIVELLSTRKNTTLTYSEINVRVVNPREALKQLEIDKLVKVTNTNENIAYWIYTLNAKAYNLFDI